MVQLTSKVSPTGLKFLPAIKNFSKVDFDHYGIHHEEEADCDWDGSHGRFIDINGQAIQKSGCFRGEFAQGDPRCDTKNSPKRLSTVPSFNLLLMSYVLLQLKRGIYQINPAKQDHDPTYFPDDCNSF
jgi:hypothetical protein